MSKIDIDKRTYELGVKIVKFVSAFPKNTAGIALGNQLIRSGTSIGANVEEALGAHTKSDFIYNMNTAKKEARETRYWLRMVSDSNLLRDSSLLDECEQLINILTSIVKSSKKNS